MYDKDFYRKIYDLLCDHGQIRRDPKHQWYQAEKEHFASYFTDDRGREWRFGGDLGFGGKFWANDGLHYVSCYTEDRTAKRNKLIITLNAAITKLEHDHVTK